MSKKRLRTNFSEYEFLKTGDGSYAITSSYYDEMSHSSHGAWAETMFNYVEPCRVAQRMKHQDICVFEVGFATGTGLSCSMSAIKKLNSPYKLDYISCEIDGELALYFCKKMQKEGLIKGLQYNKNQAYDFISANHNYGQLKILVGDIRQVLPLWLIDNPWVSFDAIYQDAFSPKRNSELWTYEWFKLLKIASSQTAILSTYSATKSVWKSLIAAGWSVQLVTGFAAKSQSTRATLVGESDDEVLTCLKHSPAQVLHD